MIDSGVFVYAGGIVRFQATGSIQMSTDGGGRGRSRWRAIAAPGGERAFAPNSRPAP